MKRLLLFDIDGTLTDTVAVDDRCFIQAFSDLHDVDLSDTDWSNYTHVTDTGLFTESVERELGRQPETGELDRFEEHFALLIQAAHAANPTDFAPIPGAVALVHALQNSNNYQIAFATGGFRQTALLKLEIAGIPTNNIVLASSNDHISRAGMVRAAIERTEATTGQTFKQMAYIGDGSWDLKLANEFGMAFLGLDAHESGKLTKLGANTVLPHFEPVAQTLGTIDQLFANA